MAEPSIFVTGATGTVGAAVVEALLERGAPVRAGARRPEDLEQAAGDAAEPVRFDFADVNTWPDALRDADRLFLMRPPAIADVSVFNRFVDAARAAGVQHVVFLSVLGAERSPFIPHRQIERHLERYGPAWTFLRPSYFMQNLAEEHADEVRTRDEVFVPAGSGRTGFIDARDIGSAAALALTEGGHWRQAYTLTGSEALTYAEVAAIMADVLGRPITYADPGPLRFAWERLQRGDPLAYVLVLCVLYTVTRLGLAATVTDDAERLLGRKPIPFRRFVEDYREVWEPDA